MNTYTHTHTHYIYIYFRSQRWFLRTTRASSTCRTGTKVQILTQVSCFTSTKSTNTDLTGEIFLFYQYKSTNTDASSIVHHSSSCRALPCLEEWHGLVSAARHTMGGKRHFSWPLEARNGGRVQWRHVALHVPLSCFPSQEHMCAMPWASSHMQGKLAMQSARLYTVKGEQYRKDDTGARVVTLSY